MTKHKRKRRARRRQRSTAPQVPPRPPRLVVDERPERVNAPWSPFPLVELVILAGVLCLIAGFVVDRNALVVLGVVLAALGGLETSAREHFTGFRSHSLVLAGVPAIAAAVGAAYLKAPLFVVVPVMLGVFAAAFAGLRRAWRPRTTA